MESRGRDVGEIWREDGSGGTIGCYLSWPQREKPYLSEWLWRYFYRLYEKRKTPLTLVAFLLDNDRQYCPRQYTLPFCGGTLRLGYASLKLMDYFDTTEAQANPMARCIEMHRLRLATEENLDARLTQLCALMKQWHQWRYSPEVLTGLYRFKAQVLPLPAALNDILVHEMTYYEKSLGVNALYGSEFFSGNFQGKKVCDAQ